MIPSKTWAFIRMLVQRCTLEEHRLVVVVSLTKPAVCDSTFQSVFSGNQFRALIDTGAQRSVLTRLVIADLNLVRTGHMQFAGLHGPRTHSRYLAGIGLWAKRVDKNRSPREYEDAELTLYSIEEPFEVVDMDNNMNFDMILGFDVLKNHAFNFNAGKQEFELIVQA